MGAYRTEYVCVGYDNDVPVFVTRTPELTALEMARDYRQANDALQCVIDDIQKAGGDIEAIARTVLSPASKDNADA